MNNNFNLSQGQLDNLVNLASKKMGIEPEALKQQMQSNSLDGLLGNLNTNQRSQLNNLMNNPDAVQQFISNPQIQMLLKGLMGK